MILRSIQVEGWRCFPANVEVGPFIDGLNIVHGPNGIGKSTLMTALARGLFDSHNAGGADIKALRPWGRSLNPKVTLEFEQDGESFQLHKQFLNSPSVQLSRLENGQYVPLAESRAADDKARELLSGDAPARGASDQRHWGFAQILWATQGHLGIDQLAPGTRATIQDALGAQVAGPGTQHLERKVTDAYGQFFTATGKLKTGASAPAIIELESQLEEANAKCAMLAQRRDEFDARSRHIEDLQRQAESARHSEQDLIERVQETRQQAQVYNELLGEQKLHQQKVSAAEESYRNLRERIDAIGDANDERDTMGHTQERLHHDSPAQATLVAQCQDEAKAAEQSVKEIRARRNEVTAARQLAQLAERFTRTQETLNELDKQLKQIEATQGAIQQLRHSRDQIISPDKKTLRQITKVARARDDFRLKLDAALITVSVQPETETELEVTTAEETGERVLAEGDTHEIKGAPEVAFRIPGVGQFRATGPTGDFNTLRGQWESAAAKFDDLTAGFGTNEVAALEKLRAQADEVDKQISEAEVKVNTMLGGESIDNVRGSRSHAASTLDEILSSRPEWKDTPPDPTAISQQADETEEQFTSDIDDAEAANDRAQEALRLALQNETSQKTEIASLESQIAAMDKRLESLRNDGLDDKQRSDNLTEIALQRDAAQGKLAQDDQKIKELGDDPSKSLAVLEGQLDAFRADAADSAKQLNTESGRLEQIIAEAPYSALAAVEEEVNRLDDEIARQRLEIDAIRLLHETLADQKRNVMQSILGPIRLRANHILQRISGTRFDDIQFDESLLPSGISPRSVDEFVTLDQISGGEREQVYFAVRMALADVAFPGERQLVVLDDVFTYTDTPRLARIATILDEAAEQFQIILLSCHPERYRGLPNAQFLDLGKIAAGEQ
tara:strand:- start:493 stop:3207 length:2715 start_codon:yes stop_codon:yes gene_type:complete